MTYEITFGKDKYHLINDMVTWCYENFGDGGLLANHDNSWAAESAFGNTFFKFKNEHDLSLFALR